MQFTLKYNLDIYFLSFLKVPKVKIKKAANIDLTAPLQSDYQAAQVNS